MHKDKSLQDSYDATQKKIAFFRGKGCTTVVKWECDSKKDRENNPLINTFLATQHFIAPLNPRDAFFGGRTNAVKLHHHVDDDEKIHYQDVTSLYPWVNKYATYPVKHPQILTGITHTDITSYFELAQVTILPPHELYHPVLPFRHGGKLTFPLCRTCVQNEMGKPLLERSSRCAHSSSQRQLTGTWCTPELCEAVRQRYFIITIHEVWHFPPKQRKTGLFADYVNTSLKIKTESSGYPSWANTPDKKAQYVSTYQQHEVIALDPDKIEKNPGRKTGGKLMLNSFWGKFSENTRKSKTSTVRDPAHLFEILGNPTITVTNLRIYTPECLEVVYNDTEDEYVDNGKINIFVAAFTTCYARLKLYEYLNTLQKQVLYFDTDSVIYTCKPSQPKLTNGDYLGELTDELGRDDYIVDFTSGGPKNYGYQTHQGKTECKVRGFTLSSVRGSRQLNYPILQQNVLDEITNPLDDRRTIDVMNPHFFTHNPATKELKVIPRNKVYGLVFDKRVIDPDTFQSYPYGYTRECDCACDLFEGSDDACTCY